MLLHVVVDVLLEATLKGVDLATVREHIQEVPGVVDVHDLHASTVATGLPTLTAHVVVEDECFTDGHAAEVLHEVRECVAGHFPVSIQHSTFQIETAHLTEDEPALVRHR